jgi:hypothetical protein
MADRITKIAIVPGAGSDWTVLITKEFGSENGGGSQVFDLHAPSLPAACDLAKSAVGFNIVPVALGPDYSKAASDARQPDGSISASRFIANCDAELLAVLKEAELDCRGYDAVHGWLEKATAVIAKFHGVDDGHHATK